MGGSIDAAVAGASFFVGTLLGAAIGGAMSWASANRLAELKVLSLPLGGQKLRYGPARSANLPHVIVGRAIYHQQLIANRTHARRDAVDLHQDEAQQGQLNPLSDEQRKALEKAFTKVRRARRDLNRLAQARQTITEVIAGFFKEQDQAQAQDV